MDKALTSDIQIDAAGDITLLVKHGDEWVTFQVSSKAMSLASPVWRAMLDPNGPFRESRADNNEITFPDDYSKALLILLLAAHLRFQDVPQNLTFEQLLNVCILCDKYDCITLVRPWISKWLDRQRYPAGEKLYEEWLFIAWTTGDEATFESTGRNLILHANPDGSRKLNEGIPEARLQTITMLIDLTHTLVDHYDDHGEEMGDVGNQFAEDSVACDNLSFGSPIRANSYRLITPWWNLTSRHGVLAISGCKGCGKSLSMFEQIAWLMVELNGDNKPVLVDDSLHAKWILIRLL
ncbi:MAG: hypothetical protein Q9195_002128 [Heterodermia aff. obscurata]